MCGIFRHGIQDIACHRAGHVGVAAGRTRQDRGRFRIPCRTLCGRNSDPRRVRISGRLSSAGILPAVVQHRSAGEYMAHKKGILEKLKEGPVLGDGGYLLELEKRGWVRAGPFTPEVALTHPEALRELHVEFREAGAEVLQALTFYASRDKLKTVGLDDRLEDLNRAAVRIA